MKLGVFAALFADKNLDEMLDTVAEAGLEAVELGTGNYPGSPHMNVKALVSSIKARTEFLAKVRAHGLEISALSCHGNPLHPMKKIAKAHHETWRSTVKLAKLLDIGVVAGFSGCPGGCERDKTPNWTTCPWPTDFTDIHKWQWDQKCIPYWRAEAKFARNNGVKIGFEMHPGFLVYNTETLLKIRGACGENVGANFDPSHLFWQGMDPLVSLKKLKGAIFHVHAKDCRLDPQNAAENGVLDMKHYGDVVGRSWIFRTVGYGHGEDFWCDFVSTLRKVGYDGVISIEHEDALMSADEGFHKAVEFLQGILLHEKLGKMWWA